MSRLASHLSRCGALCVLTSCLCEADYVRMLKYGDSLYRCKELKRAALVQSASHSHACQLVMCNTKG